MISFLRSPGTTPIKAKFGRKSLATYHNYKHEMFVHWVDPTAATICGRTPFCHKVLFDCFYLTLTKIMS